MGPDRTIGGVLTDLISGERQHYAHQAGGAALLVEEDVRILRPKLSGEARGKAGALPTWLAHGSDEKPLPHPPS